MIDVVEGVITQSYGCTWIRGPEGERIEWLDPSCPDGQRHAGIDVGCAMRAPVRSPRAGYCVQVGIEFLGDQAVALLTDDGVFLEFGHLDQALVSRGTRVAVGDVLGLAGTRGRSSGPHLHLEARLDGPLQGCPSPYLLDPSPFLTFAVAEPAPEDPVTPQDLQAIADLVTSRLGLTPQQLQQIFNATANPGDPTYVPTRVGALLGLTPQQLQQIFNATANPGDPTYIPAVVAAAQNPVPPNPRDPIPGGQ